MYDCEHAACLVHVLRDLVFLAQQWIAWAADLKSLLLDRKEATEQGRELGKRRLDPQEVVDWEAQFLRLLDEGDQAHPRATAPPGQRGRCKQSDARNLLDRLRKRQKAVLTFLEDFDKNLAERDLRMVKVQQKVSGCFRSLAGAQAFARIRGYKWLLWSTKNGTEREVICAKEYAFDSFPTTSYNGANSKRSIWSREE